MENNNQQPTTLPAVLPMREVLPSLLEKYVPWMEKKSVAANELLDSIADVNSEEEAEDTERKLAAVREVYNAISTRRKEMTAITDAFKNALMEFERPLDNDSKAKNKYNEGRKKLEDYRQRVLEERRKHEQEIAKRKELENFKVDLKARILKKLNDNITETVQKADEYSRQYFNTVPLDTFDEHAEKFKKMNPKLSQTTFDKCFECPTDMLEQAKKLMSAGEFKLFVSDLQKEETYEKWNKLVQEAVAPKMNEWRAKIPTIKQELIERENASETERKRLEEEKRERDANEAERTKQELEAKAKAREQEIQQQANLDKMSNEFAAQAGAQSLEDAGGVKLVLKFNDDKKTPQALMNIIYHCLSHKDFPGIVKRDKSKKQVFDSKGRPEYIDAIQYWIDFFLKNCNADIDGTIITEDAKVVVRK